MPPKRVIVPRLISAPLNELGLPPAIPVEIKVPNAPPKTKPKKKINPANALDALYARKDINPLPNYYNKKNKYNVAIPDEYPKDKAEEDKLIKAINKGFLARDRKRKKFYQKMEALKSQEKPKKKSKQWKKLITSNMVWKAKRKLVPKAAELPKKIKKERKPRKPAKVCTWAWAIKVAHNDHGIKVPVRKNTEAYERVKRIMNNWDCGKK
jgi:hypothetical protein